MTLERPSATSLVFMPDDDEPGLHARSAAFLIRQTAGLDCRLTVSRQVGGVSRGTETFVCNPPAPGNFLRLCKIGILRRNGIGDRDGERIVVSATGRDADEAIDAAVVALKEAPPPVGSDVRRLEAWVRRRRAGMRRGPALRELDEELLGWLEVCRRPDLAKSKAMGRLIQAAMRKAYANDRQPS